MRLKDRLSQLYVFGESADGAAVDIAHRADDLLTGVKKEEAERLIALFNGHMDAIWKLLDKVADGPDVDIDACWEDK